MEFWTSTLSQLVYLTGCGFRFLVLVLNNSDSIDLLLDFDLGFRLIVVHRLIPSLCTSYKARLHPMLLRVQRLGFEHGNACILIRDIFL